jgi:pimeloyl-ACP methyl ester carboxylesterase
VLKTGESRFWLSGDNVRLHCVDYGGASEDVPVVLCLPGLTRNHHDFDPFVEHFQEKLASRARIWCVDLRGRGQSGWAKDPMTYTPTTYVGDLERLIAEFAPTKLILVGTSLGGILSMLMAGPHASRLMGSIINDIGPELDPAGLQRIGTYLGKVGPFATWMHVAHSLAESQKAIYPDFAMPDWIAMAKRLSRIEPNGRIMFDYDPKIAEPFKAAGAGSTFDLWPAFTSLAQKPLLAVRGALSDLLSAETLTRMLAVSPQVRAVTVPHVGHAPVLDEPVVLEAMDSFFERVLA